MHYIIAMRLHVGFSIQCISTEPLFVLARSSFPVLFSSQNFRQGGQGLAEGSCGDNVCALCETDDSPCRKCWQGNPTATVCKCPNDHIFFDDNHTTAAFNSLFARAVFQCSLETPTIGMAFVPQLCGRS